MDIIQNARILWKRRQLSSITRNVANRLVIAAALDGVIRMDWQSSSAEMLARMDRGEGGVWCGDAATILWRAFVERGFDAHVLHFGLPPNSTHAALLVQLGGLHYYCDAYFNIELAEPIELAIPLYLATGNLAVRQWPQRPRRCFVTSIDSDREFDWWTYTDSPPTRLPATRLANFTLDGFAKTMPHRWKLTGSTLAPRVENLFLHPFAIFDERGYIDDRTKSPLLDRIASLVR